MSKQFYELGKYLANLQKMQETQKLIDFGKIQNKYLDQKEKAKKKHKGEVLDDVLDELNKQEEAEIEQAKLELADQLVKEEAEMREQQQNKFHEDKKGLVERNHANRKARLLALKDKYKDLDEPTLNKVADKLIQRLDKSTAEVKQELEQENIENVEKSRLLLVANKEADIKNI